MSKVTCILAILIAASAVRSQSASEAKPAFEVASIRPCVPLPRGTPPQGLVSPGRLHASCITPMSLIQIAYEAMPTLVFDREAPVSGGPAWIRSDRYDIEAKTEGNPSEKMMEGPMLQALLEDRFKLRIHRETKEIPVYEMTVTKTGFKLHPLPEGSCFPFDALKPVPLDQVCTLSARRSDPAGPVIGEFHGRNLDEVAAFLGGMTDRPIINRTGIPGRFDFHLEFGADLVTPGWGSPPADPTGPSILTALQEQVGLRLVPAKGPGIFWIVDRVERPSEN